MSESTSQDVGHHCYTQPPHHPPQQAPSTNRQCELAVDIESTQDGNIQGVFPCDPDTVNAACGALWYKFVATEDQMVSATFSEESEPFLDLYVFRGSSCDDDDLDLVLSRSDVGFSNENLVWAAYAGETYYVVVYGEDDNDFDGFTLLFIQYPRPPNDSCSGAVLVDTLPSLFTEDTTVAFPNNFVDPCGDELGSSTRSLWYRLDEPPAAFMMEAGFSPGSFLLPGRCPCTMVPPVQILRLSFIAKGEQIQFNSLLLLVMEAIT